MAATKHRRATEADVQSAIQDVIDAWTAVGKEEHVGTCACVKGDAFTCDCGTAEIDLGRFEAAMEKLVKVHAAAN